jgi:Protein of unknown function (DUF3306)
MSHAEVMPSLTRQFQMPSTTACEISSGREIVGQAVTTIMQVFVFVLSIACLFISLTTLVLSQERADDNEILEAANLHASSVPEEPASALDLASLPSLDSIDAQTDITVFLQRGVPEGLQLTALRRAWSVNPAIRDFKGMAENDWDFNAPHTILGFGELGPSFDVNQRLAQLFKGTPMDAGQRTTTLALVQESNSPLTIGLGHGAEVTGWRQQLCLQSADWQIVSALLFCWSL